MITQGKSHPSFSFLSTKSKNTAKPIAAKIKIRMAAICASILFIAQATSIEKVASIPNSCTD